MFQDKSGNLWLSGGSRNDKLMALYRYDGKTFAPIMKSRQVFGVTQDVNGNIWIGTENGVSVYNGKSVTAI
jgi:ligand-binding sensor domain-containing protein